MSQTDANAAILALARVYDPKAVRAGETFDISFTSVRQQPIAQITYTPPSAVRRSNERRGRFRKHRAGRVPETPIGKLLRCSYRRPSTTKSPSARGANGAFTAQDVHKIWKRVTTAPAPLSIPVSISRRCRPAYRPMSSSK